jgi:hypothetical protein
MIGIVLLAALRPCVPLPPSRNGEITRCAALLAGGKLRIVPEALRRLSFAEGPAVVEIDGSLFRVDRRGRTSASLPFDNGADPFVEGVARTVERGKIGFVDRRLRLVIRPRWDFASPFHGGVAAVCQGCRLVTDGEHRRVEGGRWGWIDRAGRVVVPVVHAEKDLPSEAEARRRVGRSER